MRRLLWMKRAPRPKPGGGKGLAGPWGLGQLLAVIVALATLTACTPEEYGFVVWLYHPPATPVSCPQWVGSTRGAGFTESELPTVHRLMRRESGCLPWAWNRRSGDYGLLQIHHTWIGTLCRAGITCSLTDLFNPDINLRAARLVFLAQGWRAWVTY